MGGGKSKKPKVEEVNLPPAATPAPPPEQTAQTAVVDEGALRHKERDAKRKGTNALKIDLNVNSGAGTATPGGSSGLSIPKG